jgi:hypothetical protein
VNVSSSYPRQAPGLYEEAAESAGAKFKGANAIPSRANRFKIEKP